MHVSPQAHLSMRELELAHAQQEMVRSIWLTQYESRSGNGFSLDKLYEDAKWSDPDLRKRKVQAANCSTLLLRDSMPHPGTAEGHSQNLPFGLGHSRFAARCQLQTALSSDFMYRLVSLNTLHTKH